MERVSGRWYGTLLHDRTLIDAILVSLRVAVQSSTIATLVGTASGYALAQFGLFRFRRLFEASVATPLVLPDVITGLMLLLFVTLEQVVGWPRARSSGW
jgi:putrescine transport system permease protein